MPSTTESIPNGRPRVGLLALTLELYEDLAPGLRQGREAWLRREIVPLLAGFCDVEFNGAVYRRREVEAAVSRYEERGCDALVIVLLTYSPSQIALPALVRTRLPILIWNTQELRAVDDAFSGESMVNNHGVHGTQDLANVLLRSGIPFEYCTSHPADPDPVGAVRDFCMAAAAVRRLRGLRIGRLGYPFPGMGDFAVDTTDMAARLGCDWVPLGTEEFSKRAAEAEPEEVEALVREYRSAYAVAADVTAADLEVSARAEIAIRGMVQAHGLGALTYQFLAFGEDERSPTLPFVAASRLMAEGIGFGGEGDLIAAAGCTLLQSLAPPAGFTEIFTIDFSGNALLLSHMGEMNVAMARRDGRPRLCVRPKPITRTRGRQLALAISLEPGPATLMALTLGPGRRWRLLAAPVTIEDFGPLPSLVVPHSKVRTPMDVREFLTRYARAGGPHHNALCFGDARARLRRAAAMLDADYVEISPE